MYKLDKLFPSIRVSDYTKINNAENKKTIQKNYSKINNAEKKKLYKNYSKINKRK